MLSWEFTLIVRVPFNYLALPTEMIITMLLFSPIVATVSQHYAFKHLK
jgi:hypothetical protein